LGGTAQNHDPCETRSTLYDIQIRGQIASRMRLVIGAPQYAIHFRCPNKFFVPRRSLRNPAAVAELIGSTAVHAFTFLALYRIVGYAAHLMMEFPRFTLDLIEV
jgi:hypothetical protein